MCKDALICLMTGKNYTDQVAENLLNQCVFCDDFES
jgi:hypothetical protein